MRSERFCPAGWRRRSEKREDGGITRAEALAQLSRNHEPMGINQADEGKAILQDIVSPEESQELLALLKILALGNEDVRAGRVKPVSDVMVRLRAKLAKE